MLPRAAFRERLARALAAEGWREEREAREPDALRREIRAVPWAPWKTGYSYSAINGSWIARS